MKKTYIVILSVLIFIAGLYVWSIGVNAIPGDVEIIQSKETVYGKAILFEDKDNRTFGVAKIKKYMGILNKFDGGSYRDYTEENKPFEVASYGTNDKKDSFIVGIMVAKDSSIKYITLGNYMEEVQPNETYELTLEDVEENIEDYQLVEVNNRYALFVVDEYTKDTRTIRGFDEKGNLIADKKYAEEPRYLK